MTSQLDPFVRWGMGSSGDASYKKEAAEELHDQEVGATSSDNFIPETQPVKMNLGNPPERA
jgi:hypothetical protein